MSKINPFRPNYPMTPAMFVGRSREVVRLESFLIQTKGGSPVNFIITGERGIGKTSLMILLKYISQGIVQIEAEKFNFLVIDTDIDALTTQNILIKKVEMCLRNELGKTEKARELITGIWDFIKRLEIAGIKLNPAERQEHEALISEEFSYSLAETVNRIVSAEKEPELPGVNYDGVLILIDEADKASDQLNLGTFVKQLTERLQRRGCDHVLIGLIGLPEIRNVLIRSHPSSLRIFEEMELGRLSTDEISRIINGCLDKANEDNEETTSIEEDARSALIAFSEGYPHFIQQFGYSAFAEDDDNIIGHADVLEGALGPNGALEAIGDRYYRDDFYNRIKKDSYRQVLRIMADHYDSWVTKDQIRANFRGKPSVLNNAIRALRSRNIILSKEGQKGVYRLQHMGFALWIKLNMAPPA